MTAISDFIKVKEGEKEDWKKERSLKTLACYELIDEMLASGDYDDQSGFLESVQLFIEEHEYASDRQIEAIDELRHNGGNEQYPFWKKNR